MRLFFLLGETEIWTWLFPFDDETTSFGAFGDGMDFSWV